MTGRTESILQALRISGVRRPVLEVDNDRHAVRLTVDPDDDQRTVAKVLFESLPAGILTLGYNSVWVVDASGRQTKVRFDVRFTGGDRGRVHLPPSPRSPKNHRNHRLPVEEGEYLPWFLASQGVIAWDLHVEGDRKVLWVSQPERPPEIVFPEGEVRYFEYEQVPPKECLTVRHVSQLLGKPVRWVLDHLQYPGGEEAIWEISLTRCPLKRGPGWLTVTLESFYSFLEGQGFKGDPLGYYHSHTHLSRGMNDLLGCLFPAS